MQTGTQPARRSIVLVRTCRYQYGNAAAADAWLDAR